MAQHFSTFLQVFYDVTLKFSGSLFVTSNAYFHELLHIQENIRGPCDSSRDVLLKNMAQKMKAKFDKYWGWIDKVNLMLFVVVGLDPRYKMKYVEFWMNEWYEEEAIDIVGKIKDVLFRLYNDYNKGSSSNSTRGSSGPSGGTISSQMPTSSGDSSGSSVVTRDSRRIYTTKYKQRRIEANSSEYLNDVECYLFDGNEDEESENFDILMWWKVNSSKYRVLSQVA
jgi:hypothetical protein